MIAKYSEARYLRGCTASGPPYSRSALMVQGCGRGHRTPYLDPARSLLWYRSVSYLYSQFRGVQSAV